MTPDPFVPPESEAARSQLAKAHDPVAGIVWLAVLLCAMFLLARFA